MFLGGQLQFINVSDFFFHAMVKFKQLKISDKREQRFGDIVTPFSSSHAKRLTVRKFAQD